MRESPSLAILALIEKGAQVSAHDPQGMDEAKHHLPADVQYCHDIYATFEGADCVILMTEWNAYRNLDLKRIHDTMKGNVFVDLRNVYEPKDMAALGFEYDRRWALEGTDVGFRQGPLARGGERSQSRA